MTETTTTAAPRVKLTVSQILEDLNNGLDRKAIRAKYDLSATDVTRLFQHEKLKGARVRTAPAFELEDDTTEATTKVTNKSVAKAKVAKATVSDAKAAISDDEKGKPQPEAAAVAESSTEETVTEKVPEGPNSAGIKEVAGADDDAEKVSTQKGLW